MQLESGFVLDSRAIPSVIWLAMFRRNAEDDLGELDVGIDA